MSVASAVRRVAVGADHGGFELKEAIKAHLVSRGFEVTDCGTSGKDAVDYPVFAHAVARKIASGEAERGIMVDRAGIGSAMAANKVAGARAALCYDLSTARNSREHNDANVLTLGAGLVGPDLAIQIVDLWLATDCTAERHLRRVAMIEPVRDAAAPPKPVAPEPARPKESDQTMEHLSEADVERVIRRVRELASQSGAACGSGCSDATCAYCHACAQTNPEYLRQLVGMGAARVGHVLGGGDAPTEYAGYIDHTLLRVDATAKQIEQLCTEARQYRFATVCVNACWVRLAANHLKGSPVKVCSVVGFPSGAHLPEIKGLETRRAIRDGAAEIDTVINIGALKGGDDELVYQDIRAVTLACMDGGALSKVIIEAALLTDDEKVRACQIAKRARADFVKTSTGFGPHGATAHDVALMAGAVCGTKIGVKAAGGIRSFEDAQAMIRAGATRLGASASIRIVKESKGMTVSA